MLGKYTMCSDLLCIFNKCDKWERHEQTMTKIFHKHVNIHKSIGLYISYWIQYLHKTCTLCIEYISRSLYVLSNIYSYTLVSVSILNKITPNLGLLILKDSCLYTNVRE